MDDYFGLQISLSEEFIILDCNVATGINSLQIDLEYAPVLANALLACIGNIREAKKKVSEEIAIDGPMSDTAPE